MENSSLTDSQVLHSSSLHSPSSEPPDIRNWFSSYVYESPVLDSNDNFGDSISREREVEVEEDELTEGEESGVIGESFGEFRDVTKIGEEEAAEKCTSLEDHRESQPLGMNQDSWCSQSLLSEPPDVGNWFSSYVYESPALNPSQEFGSCESEKTGLGHEIEQTLENVRKNKIGGGEGEQLNLLVKCNGNSRGNRQDNQPLRENLFSESTLEQDPKEKSVETNEISAIKEVTVSNDDYKFDLILESSETEVQTQLNGSSAGNVVASGFTNKQSISEPIVLSNNIENKGKRRVSDDGFITASKRGFSGATCKKSVEMQENYHVKETGSAFACLSRRPLSDKTNVHSDVVEIIGKWSCPQKRKPNLGPPLKQLRLERWVHKK